MIERYGKGWEWVVLWKSKNTAACLIFTTRSWCIGAAKHGGIWMEIYPLPFLIYRPNRNM